MNSKEVFLALVSKHIATKSSVRYYEAFTYGVIWFGPPAIVKHSNMMPSLSLPSIISFLLWWKLFLNASFRTWLGPKFYNASKSFFFMFPSSYLFFTLFRACLLHTRQNRLPSRRVDLLGLLSLPEAANFFLARTIDDLSCALDSLVLDETEHLSGRPKFASRDVSSIAGLTIPLEESNVDEFCLLN